MARAAIVRTAAVGPYTGDFTEVVFAAGNVAEGNYLTLTGREILLMWNTSADTAYYVTIDSVDDQFGRQEDITELDIAFGDIEMFGPINMAGWAQSNGQLYVNVENAAILLGCIVIP